MTDHAKHFWRQWHDKYAKQSSQDWKVGRWASPHFFRIIQERFLRLMRGHCPSPRDVLDVSCGSGDLIERLTQRDYRVTGTDISLEALKRLKETPSRQQLPVSEADAAALPFRDASFDLVLSTGMLQCVADIKPHFLELARILRKPQGQLLVLFSPDTRLTRRRLRRLTAHDPEMNHYRLHAVESVCEAMRAASLTPMDISHLFYVFHVPTLVPLLLRLNRWPQWCRHGEALATMTVILGIRS